MLQDEELDTQSLEDEWFAKYQTLPYKDLAQRMLELREEEALAKSRATAATKELDIIRLRVVPQRFAEDGMSSLNLPGIGRLGLSSDAYCTQKKDLQEALFDWLRANDAGDMIKDNVNASSLKSLVKELAADAQESAPAFDADPDTIEKSKFDEIIEFVNYTPFMRASVTKSSK